MLKTLSLIFTLFVISACKITPSFTSTPIKLTGEERKSSVCRFIGLGSETVDKAAKKGNIKNIKIINHARYPFVSCTEIIGD